MADIRLKYIGTEERYSEVAITGKQQLWLRNSSSAVPSADAALLLATGKFEQVKTGDVGTTQDLATGSQQGALDTASAAALAASGAYAGPTGSLTKTYAAIKRVADGMGQAFVGMFGDSTTLGAGAGTGAKGLVAAASGRPAAKFAEYLASVGIPSADNSFFGEGLIQAYQSTNFSAYDTRFATIGTASYYANGQQTSVGGIMWQLNASGEGLAFTPKIDGANSNYDTVRVWYCNRTTGSFTVSQPGAGSTAGTVTTTGAGNTIGSTTVALTRGTGVCNLEWVSGDNWIIGAVFYDSQNPRVNVLSFGQYGDKLTSATGVVNNANEWRGGAVIASMSLDCVFVDMTINSENNDGLGGVPAFTTALTTLCGDISGSGADLVLATPHAIGTAQQGTISNAYVEAIKGLASTLRVPVFDTYAKITPYATYSGALYFDTLHLNAAGNRAKGFQQARFLRATAGI